MFYVCVCVCVCLCVLYTCACDVCYVVLCSGGYAVLDMDGNSIGQLIMSSCDFVDIIIMYM